MLTDRRAALQSIMHVPASASFNEVRSMNVMQSAPAPTTTVNDREYLYFCGTGYLGLHGHEKLIQAACDATRKYGLGTATSRTGYGSAPPIVEVERLAAQLWECDDSFYFASGYMGNHVGLSALAESTTVVLLDEHSHYSIVDACRYFDLPVHTFAHRDPQGLQETLREHVQPGQTPLVMTDGVFASSGSIAPVDGYIRVLQEYDGAMLCLDDCHAFGVLGRRGRGTYEHYGIDQQRVNQLATQDHSGGAPRLYAVGTLSKAFGGYGGIVCGSDAFIQHVKNSSHYYSGASAPAIPVAAASAAALELVTNTPELVARVQQNARRLREGLKALGLDVGDSPVPVVGLTLGDQSNMRRIQQGMADEGMLIAYATKYSGLKEDGALRLSVFATHTEENIRDMTECLGRQM